MASTPTDSCVGESIGHAIHRDRWCGRRRLSVTFEELAGDAKTHARAVEAAGFEKAVIDAYYRHAMFFVRWLAGCFEPGVRLRGR